MLTSTAVTEEAASSARKGAGTGIASVLLR